MLGDAIVGSRVTQRWHPDVQFQKWMRMFRWEVGKSECWHALNVSIGRASAASMREHEKVVAGGRFARDRES